MSTEPDESVIAVVARREGVRAPKAGKKIGKVRTNKKGKLHFRTAKLKRGTYDIGLEYTSQRPQFASDYSCADSLVVPKRRGKGAKERN